MKRTNWFERQFPPVTDDGLLPGILERLTGTPGRLRAMTTGVGTQATLSGWSAAKEIGHLADLEPLWLRRVHDILDGHADLAAADLSNRATNEADHDARPFAQLIDRFESARSPLSVEGRGVSD